MADMSSFSFKCSMIEILTLFQEATVHYRLGHVHDARIGFVAVIQKLKSLNTEGVSHGEIYDELQRCLTKMVTDESRASNTKDSYLCQQQLLRSKPQQQDSTTTTDQLDFMHFQSNDIHSTITFPQIGFFDGLVPLSNKAIDSIDFLGAVLIYNLAVTTHVTALSKSDDFQSLIFDKALHLYGQAQSLLDTCYSKTDDSFDMGFYTLLKAAIIGNMAQIYRDCFLNIKVSDILIENLKRIVAYWIEDCILDDTIPEHYLDLFASHVRLSPYLNIQTSPAA
jgi:hypothetical protein